MLISDAYRKQQQRLHERDDYGVASLHYAPLVAAAVERLGVDELLDYGCGKGRLGPALAGLLKRPVGVRGYDPAVPERAARPEPAFLVACIDVLEHIEPECLDDVLDDLRRVTRGVGVFTVHCGPAMKTLDDGRNAHLTQRPVEWWRERLASRFEVLAVRPLPEGACFEVARRPPWWARALRSLLAPKGAPDGGS